MKNKHAFLIAAACIQPALSQIVVEETVVIPAQQDEIIVETVLPHNQPPVYDPAFARRHLLVEPRAVPVPEHPPGTVVETTETRDYVEVPGQPRRVYNVERNVVIVEGKELPYVVCRCFSRRKQRNFWMRSQGWRLRKRLRQFLRF